MNIQILSANYLIIVVFNAPQRLCMLTCDYISSMFFILVEHIPPFLRCMFTLLNHHRKNYHRMDC